MARRVLICGMNYAPEIAGVGRYTGEIAEFLVRQGDQVVVVTTPAHYPGWRVEMPFNRRRFTLERRNDVRVIRCPLLLRRNMVGLWRLIAPLSFALTSAPVLLWQIARFRPHIVLSIAPTLLAAPALLLGARIAGSRTVLHVHDLEMDAAFAVGHLRDRAWIRMLGNMFERFTVARFHRIITISDRMAEKIAAKGVLRDRVAVVRNWVDLDHIRPLEAESPYRPELNFGRDDFVVLYSGTVGRKQSLDVLLMAAELLMAQGRIQFVIAGEGPAKEALVQRFGSLANVKFLPFQPMTRLSEFLGLADAHVLPQDSSIADLVLPSKLGGMLASGKPVIVMADPGTELTEFLQESAIVVPPGDAAGLADAILAASRNECDDPDKLRRRLTLADCLSKRHGLPQFVQAIREDRAA